jgi:hypothetical protein
MFGCDKINKTEKKQQITKYDIYMITGIFIVALLFLFRFHIFGQEGCYAVVSYDGVILEEVPLSDTEERYFLVYEMESNEINQENTMEFLELTKEQWSDWELELQSQEQITSWDEYNVFVCKDGRIQMLQSSCPDKICVHHAEISKTGESIICLPHKLVIEISNAEEKKLDGVVY